jgi:hypothetical protein
VHRASLCIGPCALVGANDRQTAREQLTPPVDTVCSRVFVKCSVVHSSLFGDGLACNLAIRKCFTVILNPILHVMAAFLLVV